MKNVFNICSLILLFFLIIFTIIFLCFDLPEIINLYNAVNSGEVFFHYDVALELYNSIILFSITSIVLISFIAFIIIIKSRKDIVCFIKKLKNKQQNKKQIKATDTTNNDTFLISNNFRKSLQYISIALLLIFVLVFSIIQLFTHIQNIAILKINIDNEGAIFILRNDISKLLPIIIFLEISTLIISCGAFLRFFTNLQKSKLLQTHKNGMKQFVKAKELKQQLNDLENTD